MSKNLGFIFNSSFSYWDYERYCLTNLNKNFNLFFFNLNFTENLSIRSRKINLNVVNCSSIDDFKKKIKNLDIKIIITNNSVNENNLNIFNYLKNNNIKLGLIDFKHFSPITKLKRKNISIFNLFFILNNLKFKIFRNFKSNSIKEFDFDFYIGNKNNKKNHKQVNTHHFDYYKFKKTIKLNNKYSYITFLDDAPADHPDYKKLNISPHAPLYLYKINIIRIFKKIENFYNCKIVVAGHPRMEGNQKHNKIFQGRKVIFNKTAELVANSMLVITHASESVNFAVMSKKKIIFLNSNIFLPSYRDLIDQFSQLIGANTLNFSKNNCYELDKLKINLKKYKKYERDYIINKKISLKHKMWSNLKIK